MVRRIERQKYNFLNPVKKLYSGGIIQLLNGNGNNECQTFIINAFSSNHTIMFFYDLFDDGQSNTCSFIGFICVKPLKNSKNFIGVNYFKANTIVLNYNSIIFSIVIYRRIKTFR